MPVAFSNESKKILRSPPWMLPPQPANTTFSWPSAGAGPKPMRPTASAQPAARLAHLDVWFCCCIVASRVGVSRRFVDRIPVMPDHPGIVATAPRGDRTATGSGGAPVLGRTTASTSPLSSRTW